MIAEVNYNLLKRVYLLEGPFAVWVSVNHFVNLYHQ